MRSSNHSICWNLLLLLCVCAYSISIEPISFGIITNDDFRSPAIPTILTLYWNNSLYECTIEPSTPNHFYQCDIEETTNKQTQNELIMNKIHIISSNHISIKSIIVWDENNNYHEINMFCPVNTNTNCDNSLSILGTIITFPSIEILTTSPNQSHQGFVHHFNHNNLLNKRKLIDTGTAALDLDYFTFTFSDLPGSGPTESVNVYMWWQEYKIACVYNSGTVPTWPIPDGTTVVCNDTYPNPTGAFIIADNINPATFKMEFRYVTAGDDIRIDSIKVYTVNGNYYEIDEFCVPIVFNVSDMNINTACSLYSHKYSLPYLTLNYDLIPIVSIQFQEDIPSLFANQAVEGLVSLPEPPSFKITLTDTAKVDNLGINYTLYWDEYIIRCNADSTSSPVNCLTATAITSIECNHESKFMLHIYNEGEIGQAFIDFITISEVQINDIGGNYGVDKFCIDNLHSEWQPTTSNSNGSCTQYPALTLWNEVCVGDGTHPVCSDKSIIIEFPQNILETSLITAFAEAQVINGDNVPATCGPTTSPTKSPTKYPTNDPTFEPTVHPTSDPTSDPTNDPTLEPTIFPTKNPTSIPTFVPTKNPTSIPTFIPTNDPTQQPTNIPTKNPITGVPTTQPTSVPTITTTTPTTDPTNRKDDLQSNVFEDNPVYVWLDKSNTNKIIAGIGFAVLLLICCLICYICFITKKCCFKNKQKNSDSRHAPQSSSREQLKSNTTKKLDSIDPLSFSSMNDTARAPNISRPNAVSLPSDSINIQMISRKKPRTFTSPQLIVPLNDEFYVTFTSKPFGMAMSTLKKDKYNLYVSKVQIDSQAAQNNVKVGYKLVALNGNSLEGIGSKEIYRRIASAGVPVRILFRKRGKKRKKYPRRASDHEIPSQSDGEGSFDADFYEDMYNDPVPPGTPVAQRQQTPSTHGDNRMRTSLPSAMNLDPVQEHKYPSPDAAVEVNVAAYGMAVQHIKLQHAGAGDDGNITGHNVVKMNNSADTSSDSDQMYDQGDDTPTLDAQETLGAHVQSKESIDLQLVAKSSVDIPDLDSSVDNNEVINIDANVEEIEYNYEVDVDDDGNFVFQT